MKQANGWWRPRETQTKCSLEPCYPPWNSGQALTPPPPTPQPLHHSPAPQVLGHSRPAAEQVGTQWPQPLPQAHHSGQWLCVEVEQRVLLLDINQRLLRHILQELLSLFRHLEGKWPCQACRASTPIQAAHLLFQIGSDGKAQRAVTQRTLWLFYLSPSDIQSEMPFIDCVSRVCGADIPSSHCVIKVPEMTDSSTSTQVTVLVFLWPWTRAIEFLTSGGDGGKIQRISTCNCLLMCNTKARRELGLCWPKFRLIKWLANVHIYICNVSPWCHFKGRGK